jgi:hypothetical protein
MPVKKYYSGVPTPAEIREIISEIINEEAFVQFPCDFGHTPLNTMMFAFENPQTTIKPLIRKLRKNGIPILSVEESPLDKYPVYPFTKWYNITFMAYSHEN